MTAPTRAVRQLVYDRDGLLCARCGTGQPLTLQHRVARGMGGNRAPWVNGPANLLTLCGSGTTGCHGWVEAHPVEADVHGWSAPRWAPLDEWAVWTWRGWVNLSTRGTTLLVRPADMLPEQRDAIEACTCGCLLPVPFAQVTT